MRPEFIHPDPTQIHQGELIQQFIRYIEIKKKAPYPDKAKQITASGLCFGFSVVHSYMSAKGKANWWENTLKKIARWDQTEASLQDEEGRALDGLMHRAVNYILYNFACPDILSIDYHQQKNFLAPGGLFVSEDGGIIAEAAAAGNFSVTALDALFIPSVFSQEAIYLLHSLKHSCSIHYADNTWYFYDPNNEFGQKAFTQKHDLLNEIIAVLGTTLIIQIASWKDRSAIDFTAFHDAYHQLLSHDFFSLVTEKGFQAFLKLRTDQTKSILTHAVINNKVSTTLANALAHEAINDATIWAMLASLTPALLSNLVAMAKTDPVIRNGVAAALTHRAKNGCSGLCIVVKTAPELLSDITALAYQCPYFYESYTLALHFKNSSGNTMLEILFYIAPKHLFPIAKLLAQGNRLSRAVKSDFNFCGNEQQQRQLLILKRIEFTAQFFKNQHADNSTPSRIAKLDALKAKLDYRKAIYKIRLGIDDPYLASYKATPRRATPFNFFQKNSRDFLIQKLEATEAMVNHIESLKKYLLDSSKPNPALVTANTQVVRNGHLGEIYNELLAIQAECSNLPHPRSSLAA